MAEIDFPLLPPPGSAPRVIFDIIDEHGPMPRERLAGYLRAIPAPARRWTDYYVDQRVEGALASGWLIRRDGVLHTYAAGVAPWPGYGAPDDGLLLQLAKAGTRTYYAMRALLDGPASYPILLMRVREIDSTRRWTIDAMRASVGHVKAIMPISTEAAWQYPPTQDELRGLMRGGVRLLQMRNVMRAPSQAERIDESGGAPNQDIERRRTERLHLAKLNPPPCARRPRWHDVEPPMETPPSRAADDWLQAVAARLADCHACPLLEICATVPEYGPLVSGGRWHGDAPLAHPSHWPDDELDDLLEIVPKNVRPRVRAALSAIPTAEMS